MYGFKIGDKVIVHTCPRKSKEKGWTGTVRSFKHDMVQVKLTQNLYTYSYLPENIRKLTKLDKVLK